MLARKLNTAYPRVLVFTSSYLPIAGGLQHEVKWYLDAVDRRLNDSANLDIHFIYPDHRSEQYAMFKNIRAYNLQLRNRNRTDTARAILNLGRLLKKIRPHITHCHGILPDGLWVLVASRVFSVPTKIIVTSHGEDIVYFQHLSYGMRLSKRSDFFAHLVTKRISAHILPSQALIPFAVGAGTPLNRTIVLPNGVPVDGEQDFERDESAARPLGDARARLCKERGLTILSLSSARLVKNLDALVEAFALAKPELGQSRLQLACVGEEAKRIAGLVDKLGLKDDVEFIGEISGTRKTSYFLNSDVYCLVSHFENFPVSLLEAMKFETAVVASKVGGIPEFIKDGENGLLVSPRETSAIAAALVRLYRDDDLRKRLVDGGKRTVREYTMTRTVERHVELYRRVASREPIKAQD